RRVHEHVGRLDLLVNEALPVELAERGSETNRTAKERSQFHGPAHESIERLRAGILEQQRGPGLLLREGDRANRPGWTELLFERKFLLDLPERCRCRVLHHR